MSPHVTWIGEPAQCRCTRRTVATIEETLDCPLAWRWNGAAWVHTRWLRDPGGAR